MANRPLKRFLRGLRRSGDPNAGSDRQLLELYVDTGDEDAFEELVRRHGPMVMGVCQRVLKDGHLAEDAFQGAFLVLMRKAASMQWCIQWRDSIAGWLSGVAYRTALKAKARTCKRQAQEAEVSDMFPEKTTEEAWPELSPILDKELQCLSEKYRSPIVLCYFEGRNNEEAARQLGCSLNTLRKRLERGRNRLHDRLTKRGLALSAATMATLISQNASAALPASLVNSIVQSASQLAAGKAIAASGFSAVAVELAEGVLHQMFMSKLKIAAVMVLTTIGVLGLGVVGLVGPGQDIVPEAQAAPLPTTVYVINSKVNPDGTRTFQVGGSNLPKNKWCYVNIQKPVNDPLKYWTVEHVAAGIPNWFAYTGAGRWQNPYATWPTGTSAVFATVPAAGTYQITVTWATTRTTSDWKDLSFTYSGWVTIP